MNWRGLNREKGPMAKQQRKRLMREIEQIRGGRILVCFLNFDRMSIPYPHLDSICDISFGEDTKEPLFRVLKESIGSAQGIDLFFYTLGGSIDAVWPTVSLLREFDTDFEVLVPFRCHSAGTLLCLGAKGIVMTPIAELGPIDPSVSNHYNPRTGPHERLTPISVEDVRAYRDFLIDQMAFCRQDDSCKQSDDIKNIDEETFEKCAALYPEFLSKFVEKVHPLALGNVYRSQNQIRALAHKLLAFHPSEKPAESVVEGLVGGFHSHGHGINRMEAREIIGEKKVSPASPELSVAMDRLLREYEDNFDLRKPFSLDNFLEKGHDSLFWNCVEDFKNGKTPDEIRAAAVEAGKSSRPKLSRANALRKAEEAERYTRSGSGEREARIIGGAIESRKWSYLYETRVSIGRYSIIPEHLNIDLTPEGRVPLVPGLPIDYAVTPHSAAWVRNRGPIGVSS